MIRTDAIFDTIRMFQEEHLDVRTVTLGLDLQDCSSPVGQHLREKVRAKIIGHAGDLVRATADVERRFGIPVVNRRIAVSPIASVAAGHGRDELVRIAATLDDAAGAVGVDLLGGFSALVHKHSTPTARALIDSLPRGAQHHPARLRQPERRQHQGRHQHGRRTARRSDHPGDRRR